MLHKYLVRDAGQKLFDALASGWFTIADHDSTSYVDLGGADTDMKDPGVVVAMLSSLAGTTTTIALSLVDCDTSGGTYLPLTPVGVGVAAIIYSNALWNDTIYLPVPDFGVRRYLKLRATVAAAVVTAGVIDAWYAKRAQ